MLPQIRLEIVPHDRATRRSASYHFESSAGERRSCAGKDVAGTVGRGGTDRVRLERGRLGAFGRIQRGGDQCRGHPLVAIASTNEKAGEGPDRHIVHRFE
jgi:hypothetical protein